VTNFVAIDGGDFMSFLVNIIYISLRITKSFLSKNDRRNEKQKSTMHIEV